MSKIEYLTKSNIQIECRISNIKLNTIVKSNVEYRYQIIRMLMYQTKSHIQTECRISD